ncbi:MAG: riboflavin synthase [Candidatus Omnitrophica bacterium]|nr:riboflavin synthase [Candidatus Omnitrophota bacterium]
MFTGIIKETAKIKRIDRKSSLWQISVETSPAFAQTAEISDSVSVNGACLTIVAKKASTLTFEAVKPTLDTTNLKYLKIGSTVNLEDALKTGDKVGGHFVLGHVDCLGQVKKTKKSGNFYVFEIKFPITYRTYVVPKGSIAIEGISLTVSTVTSSLFTVNVIPYTFDHTTLNKKFPGDYVNLEFDYLKK